MPPSGLRLEPQTPDSVRYPCAIFAAAPSVEGSGGRSGSAGGDEFVQFDWPRQRVNKVVLGSVGGRTALVGLLLHRHLVSSTTSAVRIVAVRRWRRVEEFVLEQLHR